MDTKEIYVANFAEALLRSSLLLANLHRSQAIRQITICAYTMEGDAQTRTAQCVITMPPTSAFNPPLEDADGWVDYNILFPRYEPHFC